MVTGDGGQRLSTMEEAVAEIPDGSTLALGGFSLNRNCMAAACEVLRQSKRDLTLIQTIAGLETDVLVGGGCVSRLVFSGGSLDRLGRLPSIGREIERGRLRSSSYSGLSLVSRYMAGGLGLTFMPTKSLLGSDVLEELGPDEVRTMECPFTGDEQVLVRSIQPDFGIVAVQYADPRGNFVLRGATWDNKELVAAADQVILVADQVVDTDILRSIPGAVQAAAHATSVVETRWPSFPTAMYGVHDYCEEHLRYYLECSSSETAIRQYIDDYVFSTASHDEYVAKVLDGDSPMLYRESEDRSW